MIAIARAEQIVTVSRELLPGLAHACRKLRKKCNWDEPAPTWRASTTGWELACCATIPTCKNVLLFICLFHQRCLGIEMVQWIKCLLRKSASHTGEPVWIPSPPLLAQFPANVSWRIVGDSTRDWGHAMHVGGFGGAPACSLAYAYCCHLRSETLARRSLSHCPSVCHYI